MSIYRLVRPAIILSFVVMGMTFWFNEQIVPAANYQADLILARELGQQNPSQQQKDIYYLEYQDAVQPDGKKAKILTCLFYAEKFDGERMKDLTIVARSGSKLSQIVVSESAKWNSVQKTWDFFNGTLYQMAPDRSFRQILRFEHQQLALPRTPLDLAANNRNSGEMNITQAQKKLQILRLSGDEQKIRNLQVRLHQKIALPSVCVVFGLVGSALGVRSHRMSRVTSFGICVLVMFSYYLLNFIAGALGLIGALSPLVAAWLPMTFGLTAGGLLLEQAAR